MNPAEQTIQNKTTLFTVRRPDGRCRPRVRGFSASIFRSASRLKAIAALRAVTMHTRIPRRSRGLNAFSGTAVAFSCHAITAANSANGSAKTVWLKRIISRKRRSIVRIPLRNRPGTARAAPSRMDLNHLLANETPT